MATYPTSDDYMLSEEDIKLRYITPAITGKGWALNEISMEAKITDGKINLRGNLSPLVRTTSGGYSGCRTVFFVLRGAFSCAPAVTRAARNTLESYGVYSS